MSCKVKNTFIFYVLDFDTHSVTRNYLGDIVREVTDSFAVLSSPKPLLGRADIISLEEVLGEPACLVRFGRLTGKDKSPWKWDLSASPAIVCLMLRYVP